MGGPLFDALHGQLHITVTGDENDNGRRVDFQDFIEPVKPLFSGVGIAREVHIEQNHIVGFVAQQVGNVGRVSFGMDNLKIFAEKHLRGKQDVGIVIHNQNTGIHFGHSREVFNSGLKLRINVHEQPIL